MKLVFENHSLPRRLAHAVLYTHCTLGCLLAMHSASAADTTTLPGISVSPEKSGTLQSPASTGSNLDLTPFQTPASVSVITREQLEQRGDANLVDAITRSAGISLSLIHI